MLCKEENIVLIGHSFSVIDKMYKVLHLNYYQTKDIFSHEEMESSKEEYIQRYCYTIYGTFNIFIIIHSVYCTPKGFKDF